jgi:predicted O-methyltransferase YrrM
MPPTSRCERLVWQRFAPIYIGPGNEGAGMQDISDQFVGELYVKYADALREVRAEQRARRATGMRAQLDDIEAEITYLLLREYRPDTVVEIGALHGWSSTWILSALRDNGMGHLHSIDLIDQARRTVPADLAADRWRFVHGDVRTNLGRLPSAIDYLFVDAAHSARFARWYLGRLLPAIAPGTPVSVHDVFHHARALPWTEGATVLGWLRRRGIGYFTASAAHAPQTCATLIELRRELDLAEPVHPGRDNPMIFFSPC